MWVAFPFRKVGQHLLRIILSLLVAASFARLLSFGYALFVGIQRLPTQIHDDRASGPKRLFCRHRIHRRHRPFGRRIKRRNQPGHHRIIQLGLIAGQPITQNQGRNDGMVIRHFLVIDDPFGEFQRGQI